MERPAVVARGARHRRRRGRSGGGGGRFGWCRAGGTSAGVFAVAAINISIAARKNGAFVFSPGPLFRLCFLPRRGSRTSYFENEQKEQRGGRERRHKAGLEKKSWGWREGASHILFFQFRPGRKKPTTIFFAPPPEKNTPTKTGTDHAPARALRASLAAAGEVL